MEAPPRAQPMAMDLTHPIKAKGHPCQGIPTTYTFTKPCGPFQLQTLGITFAQCKTVPDNEQRYYSPREAQVLPIFGMEEHSEHMTMELRENADYFVPLYDRAGFQIRLDARGEFMWAVKIFCGGINILDGSTLEESRNKPYLASPDNLPKDYFLADNTIRSAVDGIVNTDIVAGADLIMKQFITVPFGSASSLEAQAGLGYDALGGMQIEVVAAEYLDMRLDVHWTGYMKGKGKSVTKRQITLLVRKNAQLKVVFQQFFDLVGGLDVDSWRFFNQDGERLVKGEHLTYYDLRERSIINAVYEQTGGAPDSIFEMTLAPGGSIEVEPNDLLGTPLPSREFTWDEANKALIRVQFVNAEMLEQKTGIKPQPPLLDANARKRKFKELKSVGDIERSRAKKAEAGH